MALNIQRLNFDPVTGDNPSEAFMKLDLDIGVLAEAIDGDGDENVGIDGRLAAVETVVDGLGNSSTKNVGTAAGTVAAGDDVRITGAAAKTYVDAQLATKLQSANPTFTGMMNKAGVTNQFCYRVSNINTEQGIGGTFTDWSGNRTPALQVDCQMNTVAYCMGRATHWGNKHLWGADVYEGGSGAGAITEYCFHFATGIQRHRFLDTGAMIIAGTLTQNSDYRIKDDVTTVDPDAAASNLRLSRPIEYTDSRNPAGGRLAGFIAHEEHACFPLLVVGEKDAVTWEIAYEGDTTPYPPGEEPEGWVPPTPYPVQVPVLQSVNYDRKVVYLTAGWQQHDRRIAELEEKLEAALQRIATLEGSGT